VSPERPKLIRLMPVDYTQIGHSIIHGGIDVSLLPVCKIDPAKGGPAEGDFLSCILEKRARERGSSRLPGQTDKNNC
jgi:hypothetical protein